MCSGFGHAVECIGTLFLSVVEQRVLWFIPSSVKSSVYVQDVHSATAPERSIVCFLPPFGSLKPLPWLHLLLPPCLQGGERHLLHTGSSFPTDSSHSQPAPCHLYSSFREHKFRCSFPSFYRCFKYFTGYMVVTYFLCFLKKCRGRWMLTLYSGESWPCVKGKKYIQHVLSRVDILNCSIKNSPCATCTAG